MLLQSRVKAGAGAGAEPKRGPLTNL